MGAAAFFNRDGVIRLLESRGLAHDSATGIADALQDYVVGPLNDRLASKAGERSARGRLRATIEAAMEPLATRAEMREAIRDATAPLATKDELKEATSNLVTKAELREALSDLRASLIMTMFGQAVVIAGLLALAKLVWG